MHTESATSSDTAKAEGVAFLAGNPRVTKLPDGTIDIDPQLEAFDECLKIVAACRERVAGIYIAFDHIGKFRNSFLDTTNPSKPLTKREKTKPRMSNLAPEIRAHYEPIAAKYGIALDNIHVITEEWCRLAMFEEAKTSDLRNLFTSTGKSKCQKGICATEEIINDENNDQRTRINCRGITAAIFKRLIENATCVEAVWKFDKLRCKPDVLLSGIILAKQLWNAAETATITNHILFPKPNGKDYRMISKPIAL